MFSNSYANTIDTERIDNVKIVLFFPVFESLHAHIVSKAQNVKFLQSRYRKVHCLLQICDENVQIFFKKEKNHLERYLTFRN